MATKTAIGIRREAAIKDLEALLGEGFALPTQGKDPDLLHVVQLEAICEFLRCKTQGVSAQVEIDLDNMPPGVTVTPTMTGLEVMQNLKVADKPAARRNKRK